MTAANHTTPEGLPAHPECARFRDSQFECSCMDAYDYITDVDRAIRVAERMEGRRNSFLPNRRGTGPDSDLSQGDAPSRLVDASKKLPEIILDGAGTAVTMRDFNSAELNVNEGGFWKDSEDLRCKAGEDFRRGPLDMKRFTGGPWARAKEAAK